jgi:hypothetical protein
MGSKLTRVTRSRYDGSWLHPAEVRLHAEVGFRFASRLRWSSAELLVCLACSRFELQDETSFVSLTVSLTRDSLLIM